MKLLALKGKNGIGKFTKVDDDVFLKYKNHSLIAMRTLYPFYSSGGRNLLLHRMIMSTPKTLVCDHINGDVLDNRRENLRNCTKHQNIWNQKAQIRVTKSSKFKGVYLFKGGWRAKIKFNGIQKPIGVFKSEHHAAMAYDLWAVHLYGAYARTNFQQVK